ncbi:MAG: hypothetical protein ABWZ78_11890 [Burkholderiaceae bacterium]
MARYLLFTNTTDTALTLEARRKAEALGLTVRSARSGTLLVSGDLARIEEVAKELPGQWDCTPEQRAISVPEQKSPPHRRMRKPG